MLWDLILTSYTINSLPVCCSSNKLLKTWLGKAKYFCIQYNSKTKQKPATKIQGCVFLLHWRPHAKFKPFHENFFFHPNRHLAWFCTHPFNWCLNCQHHRMFWGTFVMALSRSWYFTNLSVHKKNQPQNEPSRSSRHQVTSRLLATFHRLTFFILRNQSLCLLD